MQIRNKWNKTILDGQGVNFYLLQTLAAKVASVESWTSFPFSVGKFGKYILAASDLPSDPQESLLVGYDFNENFFLIFKQSEDWFIFL